MHAGRGETLIDRECQQLGTYSPIRLQVPPHHDVRNTRSPPDLRHSRANNPSVHLADKSAQEEFSQELGFANDHHPERRFEVPIRTEYHKRIGHLAGRISSGRLRLCA